ncbi:MAG: MBL fold metallo-hydrolase [Rhodoferax sp.]
MKILTILRRSAFLAGMHVAVAAASLMMFGLPLAAAEELRSVFSTLGTNSGPIPNPNRSEPANFVRYGDQAILVDAGDGAAEQLAKIGVPLGAVQSVLISHLHFDHTGGLFAFLSMRYQSINPGIVTIYGPPGTKRTVDALVAAMQPATEVWESKRMRALGLPQASVKVIEMSDGSKATIGKIVITAATNSHYSHTNDKQILSLAFRFDMPDRSIVYTGDTGPSDNVEKLAQNVDLLVSEIMDPEASVSVLKKARPEIPAIAWLAVEAHFRKEHLSPTEVGLMAKRANAKAVVLTHNAIAREGLAKARSEIGAKYGGPITFAEDLDKF